MRDLARIRTLTILEGLNAQRKRLVLLFIKEAGLIRHNPVINLAGADFNKVVLRRHDLSESSFLGVSFSKSNMSGVNLHGANLCKADLTEIKLNGANLTGANLQYADLTRADLRNTDLTDAQIIGVNLSGATLKGAKILDSQLAGVSSLKGMILPSGKRQK